MLYYVGYYADGSNIENRNVYPSAITKMQYIIDTLDSFGVSLQVVSCSNTKDCKAYAGRVEQINKNVSVKYFKTFGKKTFLTKILDMFFNRIFLFMYLLTHVSRNDTLLVYHSLAYGRAINWIKKIKKCRYIHEVEEIYSDVRDNHIKKKFELSLSKNADAFIFPTELLNPVVNIKNKPYVISHGTYNIENDLNVNFGDDMIHIVYAGTFDPQKGGALASIETAKFLPERYHIHILGFGSKEDTKNIQDVIEEINQESIATVTYEGLLSGRKFIEFLQKCHIGLSTQNPNASFNATSFPSKILSYMANGLRVVTVKIPVIESSFVNEDMFYYTVQSPEEIANAILKVNFHDNYDSRKKIECLDKRFRIEIKELLDKC